MNIKDFVENNNVILLHDDFYLISAKGTTYYPFIMMRHHLKFNTRTGLVRRNAFYSKSIIDLSSRKYLIHRIVKDY